jgi:hypothetical protein
MTSLSETEFLLMELEILKTQKTNFIEFNEKQQKEIIERLAELKATEISTSCKSNVSETASLSNTSAKSDESLTEQQTFKIKNIVYGQYMSFGDENVKVGDQVTPSNIPDSVFYLNKSNIRDQVLIGNKNCERFIHYANSHISKDIVWSFGKYIKDTKSRWILRETPDGWLIQSCYMKLNLVLIQKDNMYTCVPWEDIKGTDQEKFAYWLVIN